MKVKIDKSVFLSATDDDRQMELSFLLHIILYKHRYELKVTDGEILNSGSFSKLRQAEQTAIKEIVTQSIVSSSYDADCEVKIGGEQEWKRKVFSPSEAVLFLMQPVSVILENGLNDACFMEAVFRLFDPTGKLTHYVNEGWLRFENAGGCANVKNFIKSRIGFYGEKEKFLRCFVLLDGDRRFPSDDEPDKKYQKLKEKLTEWNVDYHVLEKRCMENYLPDEALKACSNKHNREWILAYMTLTAEQKDFFCIAEGFRKDITKDEKRRVNEKEGRLKRKELKRRKKSYVRIYLPPVERVFYQNVSEGNFLHLESGLKISGFKTSFPQRFTDPAFVYKSNMIDRTSHQNDPRELEHIVGSVYALL